MVRDEEPTIAPLERVRENGGPWGQENDEDRRLFRQHWVDSARAIGEKIGDRFIEITYEDICASPQQAFAPVLTTIDLGWQPSMNEAMLTRYAQ